MPRVLNFGSLNIDHVYGVEEFVEPGETVACTSYDLFAGGKGANQSAALGRAGATVFHAGSIGADGRWLRDSLAGCGVDVSLVVEVEGPTGHAIIQVDHRGENAIVVFGGANERFPDERIAEIFVSFGHDDILLLQNEMPNISAVTSQARERDMTVVLNPAPFSDSVLDPSLRDIDILILNESEAASMAGALTSTITPSTPAELIWEVARELNLGQVVLTLGADGALYLSGRSISKIDAVEVADAVDTTGAGDTFIGYFVAGLAAGQSPELALNWAAMAAAVCVTRAGALSSIPRADELDLSTPG